MAEPKGEGNPVPDAAESCGFTDSGSERYACKLRDGLTFANGDPVTAQDVKYSIERACASRPTPVSPPCSTPSTPSRPRATAR